MKAAVIERATNRVVNTIEIERDAIWEAPAGHFIVFSEVATTAQAFVDQEFVDVEE